VPRARAYPSEVDIKMVGNRENEHEMTTHEADISYDRCKLDGYWRRTDDDEDDDGSCKMEPTGRLQIRGLNGIG
jgi:hypothetical protein